MVVLRAEAGQIFGVTKQVSLVGCYWAGVTVGSEAGQIVLKQARYVVLLLACVAGGTEG